MPARDVFICHSSTNKETHARPLVEALDRQGISSWLDEAVIQPGDSIVDAVSDGVKLARYVIPIVTPDLLNRPWARRELNASFLREIKSGSTVIIPLLDVDEHSWFEAFPLLEDKLYLAWGSGTTSVAARVAALFSRNAATEWVFHHPRDYTGLTWIRCTPGSLDEHRMTLRWGPFVRVVNLKPVDGQPRSMIHHKLVRDDVPLHVSVDPAAIITVGQGPAPDHNPRAINIDEGWTRAAGAPIEGTHPPDFIPMPTTRRELAEELQQDE